METTIAAVTVFNNRARVTRQGRAQLEPGTHTLSISELPLSLIHDSVRVSGEGAGVTLLGVDVRKEEYTDVPEADIAQLRREHDDLVYSIKALEDEATALDARMTWLRSLAEFSGEQYARWLARGRAVLDEATNLGDYIVEQTGLINERLRAIEREKRDLEKAREALERRLQRVERPRTHTRNVIDIQLEAQQAAEIGLEVSYMVQRAAWHPVYDLRLEDDELVLTYLATVSQRSGEDWPAVELTLSTARPTSGPPRLDLDPWSIDVYTPRPPAPKSAPRRASMRSAMPGAGSFRSDALEEAEEMAADVASGPGAPPAPVQQAQVVSSGAAVSYRVRTPTAIPSDGTPHRTTIAVEHLGTELDYRTTPRLIEEAYLRATIENTSELTLLPGEASIFHGTAYVGRTTLEMVAPGESFEVQMGADNRLRVKRELVRRDVSKNLIGQNRRSEFVYTITLKNLLAAPAQVMVMDQIPLSRHESIKAKLLDASPPVTEQTDLNVLKWELELAPGAERQVSFAFMVEHPRSLQIVGLRD